jgi:3-hydroxyisobutyrate dehydrogenase-like beta-hydroxyacid dehydrogenase
MHRPLLPAAREDTSPIGLIGCGRMGRPIMSNILAAGFHGVVHDTDPRASEGLVQCRSAASSRDVANVCAVVLGCLPTMQAFDEALFGADGLVNGSSISLYIHLGTTGPGHVRSAAERLATAGITLLDAPISGGTARAASGTLATLLAGPEAAILAARPVLASYSARIVEFGAAAGAAQVAKLINNMISAANLAVAIEGLLAGAKAGLPMEELLDLLRHGTARSDALENKIIPHVATRSFDWGSSLEIIAKDMEAWHQMADDMDLKVPLSRFVHAAYAAGIEKLGYREDMTGIAKYFEELEGITIPTKRDV